MRIGLTIFATDQSMAPHELARAAEERGLASLYVPEHTHIPTSRLTPPPTGEPVLPEDYKRTLDPFVALAAAASVTSRIRLGTAVCLVAQRDPIVLAKEVATLDLLSRGRFVFGVGFGWNREEMEHHGVDYARRRELVREKILAMERLWADDRASFNGEMVRFEESWSWPKPVQRPRPPILFGGGGGPKLFRHIAEYGDGWMPIGGSGLGAALPRLRRAMEEAGRNAARLEVVVLGAIPSPGKLEYYASIGVTEVAFSIPSASAGEALAALDGYAGIAERFAS